MINATAGAEITAPTAVPAFTKPIADDLSRTGNHSAIALVAAGKPPPSPRPKKKRPTTKTATDHDRPSPAQAKDQAIIVQKKVRRVPNASIKRPPPRYIKAYAR